MLHRFYKSLLMAFAVCLMSGCMANSAHKPLIEGIKDSVDGTEERSQSGQTDKKSTKAAVADALEIPAPLKGIPEQILKRTGYTVSYNSETKLPAHILHFVPVATVQTRSLRTNIRKQE